MYDVPENDSLCLSRTHYKLVNRKEYQYTNILLIHVMGLPSDMLNATGTAGFIQGFTVSLPSIGLSQGSCQFLSYPYMGTYISLTTSCEMISK